MAESRRNDPFSDLAIRGLLLEFISVFGRLESSRQYVGVVPDWLKRTRQMLDDDPGRFITYDELASEVGRHPVHVARAFRKHFGDTVGGYQRGLRLSKAQILLLSRRRSMLEIALECGFSSQAHFSRSFKKVFGQTPTEFRSDSASVKGLGEEGRLKRLIS